MNQQNNNTMNTKNKILNYKGFFIDRVFPSGYYICYLGYQDGFFKADTLQGMKKEINRVITLNK